MQETKVYNVLTKFSAYELNRLQKFVESPYFNKNENCILLLVLIRKSIKKGESSTEKSSFWNRIYSQKKYDDLKFRKLCNDLLKLIEKFIVYEEFENNPLHQASYLVKAVSKQKLEKLYNSSVKTARRLSGRQLEKSASYYYYQYEIEKHYYYLADFEFHRDQKINVEEIASNLDRFYIAEKLRYFTLANSQKELAAHSYNLLFIEEIIQHIQEHKYDDVPQIILYYQIYQMNKNPDEPAHFYLLKDYIHQNIELFSIDEARDIYTAAVNYCIKKTNQGLQDFRVELLNLYRAMLENETLFIDGELSPWTFKNIVTVALRGAEYDWTEDFIQHYQHRLNEKQRENAVTFNFARLKYYRKDYQSVISLLATVNFSNVTYSLSSKALLIAAYYELDEVEALSSFLESFRTYLNRQKEGISELWRKSYLNLIKYTKRLIKIFPGDKKEIEKLRKEISSDKQIADIKWLNDKIDELEGV